MPSSAIGSASRIGAWVIPPRRCARASFMPSRPTGWPISPRPITRSTRPRTGSSPSSASFRKRASSATAPRAGPRPHARPTGSTAPWRSRATTSPKPPRRPKPSPLVYWKGAGAKPCPMQFLDQAKVYVRSGNGGNGCVSFRREKFVEFGGPDGGDGGKGGDVIVACVANLNTQLATRTKQHFKAKKGGNGMGQNRTGAKGADLVLALPPGTEILDEDGESLIADLTEPGDRIVLLRGGNGGFGDAKFKSST